MITVYTVILGGYDNLRAPAVNETGVRYVCITDEPLSCAPWEIRPAWKPYSHDSRNSRIPKILEHLHFDTEYSIYHDGHFKLLASPSALISECLNDADIAFYRHPCRRNIYDEARICEREHIGDGPEMTAQINRYRLAGIRDGLWAGGLIVRRHTPSVAAFNEAWWDEYINGCMRDQIALPAAIKWSGVKIHTIDGDILTDVSRLGLCMHAEWTEWGNNADYLAERRNRAEKTERLKALCRQS